MAVQLTVPARLSYANLFEPKTIGKEGEPKYSVSLLIPKSDTRTVKQLKDAIIQAEADGKSRWPNEFKNPKNPLHDGDLEKPDDSNYKGHYYINASAKADNKPQLVDRKCNPITDKEQLYSGCYANVGISLFPYKTGSKGVSAGLNGVQFVKDGDRLDGRPQVEDMFSVIPDDDLDTDF